MEDLILSRQDYIKELLQRRAIRENLVEWAKYIAEEKGWKIAKHHLLLLEKLQQATDGTLRHSVTGKLCSNLIVLMPPGSAKSSYTSILYPAWAIQRRQNCRVLASSHSGQLIESFSRECRNTIEAHYKVLGYQLRQDSRAVQEWATTNGSSYFCVGVGSGFSGRRADFGIIDDYIGSEEDANSKLIRDKQWQWYNGDWWPRLKPGAVQIIVANRRHEEDLVGRLLEKEPENWEVIKIPFFARENDVLGRAVGDPLWPEWFTAQQIAYVRTLPPRTQAGLYGQEPAPEDGDFFRAEHMLEYSRDEYDQLMSQSPQIYAAADWAVSTEPGANRSCFGPAAIDHRGTLYILPDLFWKSAGPDVVVPSFTDMLKRRSPLITWSEKGHISKAWGPFLREHMLENDVFAYIKEVTPVKDKETRASAIRGRMSMLTVKFPSFASWWPQARHEMLTFPGGKTDDFVDFIAHLGMGLGDMTKGRKPEVQVEEDWSKSGTRFTLGWLKDERRRLEQASAERYGGR